MGFISGGVSTATGGTTASPEHAANSSADAKDAETANRLPQQLCLQGANHFIIV
jgi:hypothetical protein